LAQLEFYLEPLNVRSGKLPYFVFGSVIGAVIIGFVLGSIAYIVVFATRMAITSLAAATTKSEKIQQTSEELQGALEQDFVTNLVRINF
jgi:hypothetical protein